MSHELDDDPRPELTRRLAEVWRSQRPTEIDVARARRRLALGRVGARRRRRVQPLAWVLVGVFAAGTVLASGLVAQPWLSGRAEPAVSRSEREALAMPSRPGVSRASRGRAPMAELPAVLPSEHEAPVLPSEREAPVVSPSEREPPAVSAPVLPSPTPKAAVPAPASSAPERTARGAWARAASALREGDTNAAQRALGDVMALGEAAERDAAALLQAQLWVQSGRYEQAAPRLEELAASGATPTIRRQAADLLRREP